MDNPPDPPLLLVHWEAVVGQVLDRTQAFPKAVRFTFAARLDTLVLDILEKLVRARWERRAEKLSLLVSADADLAVLRVFLRLCFERRFLSSGAFEALVREVDAGGRMLGGWRRSLEAT
jgi:hypothetical protein